MLYVLECTNECSSHMTIWLHVNINIYYTIPPPMTHKNTPFPQSLFLAGTRRLRLGHSPLSSLCCRPLFPFCLLLLLFVILSLIPAATASSSNTLPNPFKCLPPPHLPCPHYSYCRCCCHRRRHHFRCHHCLSYHD